MALIDGRADWQVIDKEGGLLLYKNVVLLVVLEWLKLTFPILQLFDNILWWVLIPNHLLEIFNYHFVGHICGAEQMTGAIDVRLLQQQIHRCVVDVPHSNIFK